MAYYLNRRQRARIAASGTPLESRTVPELHEAAEQAGVKVQTKARKSEIAAAIEGAATTPAPGENTTAGGD